MVVLSNSKFLHNVVCDSNFSRESYLLHVQRIIFNFIECVLVSTKKGKLIHFFRSGWKIFQTGILLYTLRRIGFSSGKSYMDVGKIVLFKLCEHLTITGEFMLGIVLRYLVGLLRMFLLSVVI